MQKTETKKGKTQNMQECVNQKRRACFRMLICRINIQQTTYSRRKAGDGEHSSRAGRQETGKREKGKTIDNKRQADVSDLASWIPGCYWQNQKREGWQGARSSRARKDHESRATRPAVALIYSSFTLLFCPFLFFLCLARR